jgi:hypothetical protein
MTCLCVSHVMKDHNLKIHSEKKNLSIHIKITFPTNKKQQVNVLLKYFSETRKYVDKFRVYFQL